MRGRWVVVDVNRGGVLAVGLSNLSAPVAARSVDDLVGAHSKVLEDLSREIAGRIAELESGSES